MEVKKANSGWLAFLISGIVAIGYGVLAIMFNEAFKEIFKDIIFISGICIAATGVIFLIAAIMRIRKKGKVAELACGYGGGIGALKPTFRS